MPQFKKTKLNKVVRSPKRGVYDEEEIYQILDAGFVCHVGYIWEDTPIVIPTAYGRDGNKIYLHGSSKNRMLQHLVKAETASLTVTHVDGLVMARAIFHHSMNYRSATIFGKVTAVRKKKEKLAALKMFSDHVCPGRWEEVREPNDKEMRATLVVAIEIESASAKIRTGPPIDDADDYSSTVWAGVLPMQLDMLPPEDDPALNEGIEPSDAIHIGRAKYLSKFMEKEE